MVRVTTRQYLTMFKKIIIIDDDAEDIEIMKESIHAIDGEYECEAFLDACEALQYLKDNASIPDLIVIDLNMPVMNGRQCVDEIAKIEKLRLARVAVSSSAIPLQETLSIFEESGAVFFQKPPSYSEMHKIFSNLLSIRVRKV
jgi:CheY-like chemotaxis protein